MRWVGAAVLVFAVPVGACTDEGPAAASSPAPVAAPSQTPTVLVPEGPPPEEVVVEDAVVGSGQAASRGDRVAVHFAVATWSGAEVVETTYDGAPFRLTLGDGGEIPGFESGLVGMQVGGRRQLVVPPQLGYGDRAVGRIPAGETLVFVVDLVEIL